MRTLLVLTLPLIVFAQESFYLKPGDRVVFYGDSITDQRLYTTFLETYVVTRFPNLPVTFVNSGWNADRVTGGIGGPVDKRIERDVTPYRPTVLTIMLAMNDAGGNAFDAKHFENFQNGYHHLINKVKLDDPGTRITLLQTSPFDDVTRPPVFDPGYNAVLLRFNEFVARMARNEAMQTVDMNAPVVELLRRATKVDADRAQHLILDRVHPSAATHMIMAETILKAWKAPAVVSAVEIDGASGVVTRAENTKLGAIGRRDVLTWEQTDRALPFPIDWDDYEKLIPLAMRCSDFVDVLNQETLRVTGLRLPRYILRIDNVEAGKFTPEELAKGINLATLAVTPMMKQAREVHALTVKHVNVHDTRWKQVEVPLEADSVSAKGAALAALDRLEEEIVKQQRAAAQPKPHRYELAPVALK